MSWNYLPPSNTPNFIPVWGIVIESHIQIDALKIIFFNDLVKESGIEISSNLTSMIEEDQEIKLKESKILTLSDIHDLYHKKDVPTHRYVFSECQKFVSNSSEKILTENSQS